MRIQWQPLDCVYSEATGGGASTGAWEDTVHNILLLALRRPHLEEYHLGLSAGNLLG